MATRDSHRLLTQEGYLFHSCISNGLTNLRKADISRKGMFYSGFFELSIGLERLMKVIVIIDHMARNALRAPNKSTLKQFSHGLTSLFDGLRLIPTMLSLHPLQAVQQNTIDWDILVFLDNFAMGARYFNLDKLASATGFSDPLLQWDAIIGRILATDVPTMKRQRAARQASALGPRLNQLAVTVFTDLSGHDLDAKGMIASIAQHDIAAPYVIYRLVGIATCLADLLSDVTDRARAASATIAKNDAIFPYMNDFTAFLRLDRQSIIAKKRWP